MLKYCAMDSNHYYYHPSLCQAYYQYNYNPTALTSLNYIHQHTNLTPY